MPIKRLSIIRIGSYKWWAFIAISVGLFASVADIGGVVVALPTISDSLGTDLPTTQWVVIGYTLAISALLLPMGRLSDIVGRKQVYLVGFAIFVIGAILAGTSQNMVWLIASRVLMGGGSAMTQGTSMAMVIAAFSDNERGKALGLQMSAVGIGAVAGPVLGGVIVSGLGWRWIFFTIAILGALAFIVGQTVLDGRRSSEQGDKRSTFDWPGAVLSTSALVTLLVALTNAHLIGWGSPPIFIAICGVFVLFGTFVWWELRASTPMMDVRLFKHKLFSLGVLASFFSFVGMAAVRFLMPFYLQAVLGYSPRQIGLIIVPAAFSMIITGPLGGRLSDRYGWTIFNVVGLMLSATGLFMLSRLTVDSSLGFVMGSMVIHTCGMGIFNAPNYSSILAKVEQSKYGVVSGFLNMVRNSANVTGIALATAIVTATMASMGFPPSLAAVSDASDKGVFSAFTTGMRVAYLAMGSLVFLGMMLSFFKGGIVGGTKAQRIEQTKTGLDVGAPHDTTPT